MRFWSGFQICEKVKGCVDFYDIVLCHSAKVTTLKSTENWLNWLNLVSLKKVTA